MLPIKLWYVNNFKKHTDFREIKISKKYILKIPDMILNLTFKKFYI